MSDYNGWKNQATWSVNVLFMERIINLLQDGNDEESIRFHIKDACNPDGMNLYGRDLF